MRRIAIAALAVFVGACTGEHATAPTPPAPPPPASPVTLVSVTVAGSNTIQVGASAQLAATATYSDNTTRVITSDAAWSSSATQFAFVSSSGLVTAISPGDLQITASFENKTSSFGVSVLPAALVYVVVSGPTSISVGTTSQLHATAKYSDSSIKDVTGAATWTSSPSFVATVSAAGLVTAISPGDVQITASVESRISSLLVKVIPAPGTPWNELPPISDPAKAYIKAANIDLFDGVTRWKNQPIVYAPGFSDADKADVAAIWYQLSGGALIIKFTANESEANIAAIDDASKVLPGTCGNVGSREIVGHTIVTGKAYFDARPACILVGGTRRNYLAHELGHIFGLVVHTQGGDLMSPSPVWEASALLVEAITWLYKVPIGTRPI